MNRRPTPGLVAAILALFLVCPPIAADAAEQKTCYDCHQDAQLKFNRKHQHAPLAEDDCEACHVRHGFANMLILKKPGKQLCLLCHADFDSSLVGLAHVHPAVSEGLCVTCHNPHASDREGLLRDVDNDLSCFVCHDEMIDSTGRSALHPPFAERNCGVCHVAHAGPNPKLLVAEADAVCGVCHNAASIMSAHVEKQILTTGLDCVDCHDPHQSTRPKLLGDHVHPPVAEGMCDACHATATASAVGPADSTWAGCRSCHDDIGAKITAAHPHAPVADGDCYLCHSAHRSPRPNLLRGGVAELCQGCHEEMAATQLASQATVHQPVREGQCQTCHDPHGSDQAKLLKTSGDQLCLGCHKDDKFAGSAHLQKGELACLDCHVPHSSTQPALLSESPRSTCATCHSPELSPTMAAHEPYRQGDCALCHDPHGGPGRNLRQTVPQLCFSCHQNIARFAAEPVKHPPVEECLNCHGSHEAPHGSLLLRTAAATCAQCHDVAPDTASRSVHRPYRDGDCAGCHNPHGSAVAGLLGPRRQAEQTPVGAIIRYPKLDSTRASLCQTCHREEIEAWSAKPVQHPPVKTGRCDACHAPHQSAAGHLLTKPANALCQTCHDPSTIPAAPHAGINLAAVDCAQCHDPHASDKPHLVRTNQHAPFAEGNCEACHTGPGSVALNEPQPTLCLNCHDDLESQLHLASSHPPARDGQCTACHNPHTANAAKLLRADPPSLCTGCHRTETHKHFHAPFAKGECLKCHVPHGSQTPSLLAQSPNALCLGCHTDLAERLKVQRRHAAIDRGCLSCHFAHGSDAPRLVRETVPQLCARCHDTKSAAWQSVHNIGGIKAETGNCMSCHDPHSSPTSTTALLKPSQHPPFQQRACNRCHTGGATPPRGTRELCGTCHAQTVAAIDQYPVPHPALKDSAGCVACHSPHVGDSPSLLRGSGFSVCLGCHTDIRLTQTNVHPPALEDCANCHTPHGGDNAHLLVEPDIMALCLTCHEDAPKSHFHPMGGKTKDPRRDGPVICTSCHSPHNSDEKSLLWADPTRALCIRCHDVNAPHEKGDGG